MRKVSTIGFERKSWNMKRFNPVNDKNYIENGIFFKFRYNPFDVEVPVHYIGKVYDIKEKGVYCHCDTGFHAIEFENITHIFQKKISGKILPNKLKSKPLNQMDYMDSALDRVILLIKGCGIELKDKKYDTRNGYSRHIKFIYNKKRIEFKIDNIDSMIMEIKGVGKRIQKFKINKYKSYRILVNKIKKEFEC